MCMHTSSIELQLLAVMPVKLTFVVELQLGIDTIFLHPVNYVRKLTALIVNMIVIEPTYGSTKA